MSHGLSIGDMAARTGVPGATLRVWEQRYGAPRPRRLAGGHRRYSEQDVALVVDVLRRRAAGSSLPAAVAAAVDRAGESERSVFAGLRRRHPDLVPRVLGRHTLLALTRAVEDEACARAEHPVLFGSFQRHPYYARSQARWEELARTAEVAVVFADFPDQPRPEAGRPIRVAVPADAPLRREWTVVCDAPDQPTCLSGWELPARGRTNTPRQFEMVWSVDATVVRDAARICAELVGAFAPTLDLGLADRLAAPVLGASADLRRAAGLLDRMLGYLDRAR